MRMRCVDAGIEDRPDDSRAGGAESTDGGVGLDGADRAVQMRAQHQIWPDPVDEPETASSPSSPPRTNRVISSGVSTHRM